MNFLTVGLDFSSAPINLREKFAVSKCNLEYLTKDLSQATKASESLIVSTCNRTEYYLHGYNPKDNNYSIYDWLQNNYNINKDIIREHSYLYYGQDGVRHIMSLASGLKSMVIGEVEILGQLKQSFKYAERAGCIDKFLNRLFQKSFATAKRVRSNTKISVNPVSVAYAAVKMASHIFSDIKSSTVLVIGAGDTAKLILTHLLGVGVNKVIIANRTVARAQELMSGVNLSDKQIQFIALPEIPKLLPTVDIVISSTASPLPIIGKGMVEKALKQRKRKPMCLIDVAVPRDIEEEIKQLTDAYLYCVDDLEDIISENKKQRVTAIESAKIIIEEQVAEFMTWWKSQEYIPNLRKFREFFLQQREEILASGFQDLDAGKDPYEVLNKTTLKLINKILHKPTLGIKQAAYRKDYDLVTNLERIFDL